MKLIKDEKQPDPVINQTTDLLFPAPPTCHRQPTYKLLVVYLTRIFPVEYRKQTFWKNEDGIRLRREPPPKNKKRQEATLKTIKHKNAITKSRKINVNVSYILHYIHTGSTKIYTSVRGYTDVSKTDVKNIMNPIQKLKLTLKRVRVCVHPFLGGATRLETLHLYT